MYLLNEIVQWAGLFLLGWILGGLNKARPIEFREHGEFLIPSRRQEGMREYWCPQCGRRLKNGPSAVSRLCKHCEINYGVLN